MHLLRLVTVFIVLFPVECSHKGRARGIVPNHHHVLEDSPHLAVGSAFQKHLESLEHHHGRSRRDSGALVADVDDGVVEVAKHKSRSHRLQSIRPNLKQYPFLDLEVENPYSKLENPRDWPDCFQCCTKILFEDPALFLAKCNCENCLAKSRYCNGIEPTGSTWADDDRTLTCSNFIRCEFTPEDCARYGATFVGECIDGYMKVGDTISCRCDPIQSNDPTGESYIFYKSSRTDAIQKKVVEEKTQKSSGIGNIIADGENEVVDFEAETDFSSVVELLYGRFDYVDVAQQVPNCPERLVIEKSKAKLCSDTKMGWARTNKVGRPWKIVFRPSDDDLDKGFKCNNQKPELDFGDSKLVPLPFKDVVNKLTKVGAETKDPFEVNLLFQGFIKYCCVRELSWGAMAVGAVGYFSVFSAVKQIAVQTYACKFENPVRVDETCEWYMRSAGVDFFNKIAQPDGFYFYPGWVEKTKDTGHHQRYVKVNREKLGQFVADVLKKTPAPAAPSKSSMSNTEASQKKEL